MCKFIFSAVGTLVLCTSLNAYAVSDGRWESFCRTQTDSNLLKSCNRADRVCEMEGFSSAICKDVRQSVLDQVKSIKKSKKVEP